MTKKFAKNNWLFPSVIGLSLITGFILSTVVIYIWWGFQIHSISRLTRTALWLLPVLSPVAFWSYRKLLPLWFSNSQKSTVAILITALALALLAATALSTRLAQQHFLRFEIPDNYSHTSLQVIEININGSPVLLNHILHSENWTEESQRMVLNGDGAAWIEYSFQGGFRQYAEILVTASGEPILLKTVLDGKQQSFKTSLTEANKEDQLLLTHKTSLSPAYFKDFLLEIFLTTAGSFILLVNLMLYGFSQNASRNHLDLYWKTFSILSAIGAFLYFYASFSTRLFGDDYCYTNFVHKTGYGTAVLSFYNNWSGRFFSNLLLLGFGEQRFAPMAQLLLWVTASTVGFYGFFKSLPHSRRVWLAIGSALFVAFSTLALTPDVLKSTYWIVSSVAVFPVLILFPLIIYTLIQAYQNRESKFSFWLYGLGVFVMTAAISTTHEVASPGILLLSFLVIFAALVTHTNRANPRFFRMILWVAGAAVIGILVIVLSPGNYNRQQNQAYPTFPGLLELIRLTLKFTGGFFSRIIESPPKGLWLATVFGFGFSLERITQPQRQTNNPRFERLVLIFIPVLGFVMVASSFVPGAYAMSAAIPLRSQIISTYFLVLTGLVWGYFAAQSIPQWAVPKFSYAKLAALGTAVLIGIVLLGNGITLLQHAYRIEEQMSSYAAVWDARDETIRSAIKDGQLIQDVVIPQIESWDGPEPKYHCIRDYYRLKYQ